MTWECPYCHQVFEFAKHQQKGGHLTNCKDNPKYATTLAKIVASNTLPRIEVVKNCLKCGNSFSQFKTEREIETGRDVAEYCGRTCANSHVVSDEHRQKTSESLSGREYPERRIRENRACVICGESFETVPSSDVRTCGRKSCISAYLSQQTKGKTGGWRPKKSFPYKGIRMDSTWEVALAQRLDDLDIRWESSGKYSFPYVDLFGRARRYFPDFYLPDYDLFVECKGAWTQIVIHKMADVQKRNTFRLIVLDKLSDIRSFNIPASYL